MRQTYTVARTPFIMLIPVFMHLRILELAIGPLSLSPNINSLHFNCSASYCLSELILLRHSSLQISFLSQNSSRELYIFRPAICFYGKHSSRNYLHFMQVRGEIY